MVFFCRMISFLAVILVATGCANMGRDFADRRVLDIQIGKTTQDDLRDMFGSPWRVGIEDGKTTWTYGRYQYRLIGDSKTKDLVIHFNKDNIVSSYVFNTTDHQE
ncbi:MAG: outer membrane protein assembly factor BamE [Desulfobacteraceae bacterium]|nr:MAG: outer membrane protein assembly factor BamE [Desulfobacteraceae bacterium]